MPASESGKNEKRAYPSPAIRRAHITLISTGIAFAALFAYLKLSRDGDIVWAAGSFLAGVGLALYLRSFVTRTG